MSNLGKGQECFLHKGNDSKVFKFGSVEYKEALKDGYVSDKAEAKILFKEKIVKEQLEEARIKAEEEAKVAFDIDEGAVFRQFTKIIPLELIATNSIGDALVQNIGDSSDRWVIAKELFESSYEEQGMTVEDLGNDDTQKASTEVGQDTSKEYSLEDMNLKDLRKLAKDLGICCVSKSPAEEVIEKILKVQNENKDNTNS